VVNFVEPGATLRVKVVVLVFVPAVPVTVIG
jgi:hypothetical protein